MWTRKNFGLELDFVRDGLLKRHCVWVKRAKYSLFLAMGERKIILSGILIVVCSRVSSRFCLGLNRSWFKLRETRYTQRLVVLLTSTFLHTRSRRLSIFYTCTVLFLFLFVGLLFVFGNDIFLLNGIKKSLT